MNTSAPALLFILLCFLIQLVKASELSYYNFNEVIGFNRYSIFDIKEDQNGKIWFGTEDGLISYNGVDFKAYTNQNFDRAYFNIKFDSSGSPWCANFSGQLFTLIDDSLHLAYNGFESGDFIREYAINKLPVVSVSFDKVIELLRLQLPSGKSRKIASYSAEKIFSTSSEGDIIHFALSSTSLSNNVKIIVEKTDSFSSKEVMLLLKYNGGKAGITAYKSNIFYYEFTDSGLLSKVSDLKNDTLYQSETLDRYSLNKTQLIQDELWLLTRDGIEIISLTDGKPKKNGLPKLDASSVLKDSQGNIWIGTRTNGVFIIPQGNIKNITISQNPISFYTVDSTNTVYFMSSSGELFRSRSLFRTIEKLNHEKLPVSPLFIDSKLNRLYFGSYQHYLNLSTNQIVNLNRYKTEVLFKESVLLSKGTYLSTSYSMAYLYSIYDSIRAIPFFTSTIDSSFTPLRLFRSDKLALSHDKKSAYLNYVDGLQYMGSFGKTQKIYFKDNPIKSTALLPDNEDSALVWCASNNGFLFGIRYGEIVDTVKCAETIYNLANAPNGLLVASKRSLYAYRKNKKNLVVLNASFKNQSDQILGMFTDSTSCFLLSGNKLICIPFGTLFTPSQLPSFSISSVRLDTQEISFQKPFEIKGTKRMLQVYCSGMQVATKNNFYYRYKLNEQEWINLSKGASLLSLQNLSEGNYTLSVKACINDANCTDSSILHFKVLPPFYKTPLFFLLSALLFILAVLGVVGYIQKKQKESLNKKIAFETLQKEMYKAKIGSLRSQMNPHFVFNSLNTIQEFIISNKKNIASEYLADFADLIRLYLKQSQEEVTALATEIKILEYYLRLEKMRLNNQLYYKLKVDKFLDTERIMIPVMLIQPYIENAVKHGLMPKKGQKSLIIELKKEAQEILYCLITDNGIGRKASEEMNSKKRLKHEAFSTQANKNRMALINSVYNQSIDIKIADLHKNGIATGTQVEIRIPLDRFTFS